MNSMLTGKIHEREIDVTPEQLKKWQGGMLIQDAMPHLSSDDREYLISGATPEEWEKFFGERER
jgi:hypothetical protein